MSDRTRCLDRSRFCNYRTRRYYDSHFLARSPINELHLQRYSPPWRVPLFVPSYYSTCRAAANWWQGGRRRAVDRRVFRARDVSRANFLCKLSRISIGCRQIDPVLQFKVLQYFHRSFDGSTRICCLSKAKRENIQAQDFSLI